VTDYVDSYCERVAPGLWEEPFNSLSTLAFLIAAVLVWRLAAGDRAGRLLAVLTGLVFVAGTTFHLLATRWAAAGDSGPSSSSRWCPPWCSRGPTAGGRPGSPRPRSSRSP
jgi:hypothetical protein